MASKCYYWCTATVCGREGIKLLSISRNWLECALLTLPSKIQKNLFKQVNKRSHADGHVRTSTVQFVEKLRFEILKPIFVLYLFA